MRFKELLLAVGIVLSGLGIAVAEGFADPNGTVYLASSSVMLRGPAARAGLDRSVQDLSSVIKNFAPQSAISQNPGGSPRVSFQATREILGHRLSAEIRGDLTHKDIECKSPFNPRGYRLEVDLQGSEPKMVDNVSQFSLDICSVDYADGSSRVYGYSRMVKGKKFSALTGPLFKGLLKAQTPRLLSALSKAATQ